jgi:hypothetical protein
MLGRFGVGNRFRSLPQGAARGWWINAEPHRLSHSEKETCGYAVRATPIGPAYSMHLIAGTNGWEDHIRSGILSS